MKLSIIIPCYNEVKYIEKVVRKIHEVSPYDNEIIVVDDCSTDGTIDVLEKIEETMISKLIKNKKIVEKDTVLERV